MKKHSKNMVIIVAGTDISTHCQESEYERTKATHKITGYGAVSEAYSAGLRDGTWSCGGTYDSDAVVGPKAVLEPLVDSDDPATVVRRPEGTGTGLPQHTFSAHITSYKESAPYADMIKWSADFQITGDVDRTPQT